jgi:CP family cyanate transporter-like MFS transporter
MSGLDGAAWGRGWARVALVVVVGINLRAFLTAPSALLANIKADTGMGYGSLALLTLLPMLLMGVGAFVTPGIQAAVGTRRGMLAAVAILMTGSLTRFFASDGLSLIVTAAICGFGVAFVQAAFPGIIKADFPTRTPAITGLYSGMLMASGALGARLTPVFVNSGFSWQAALTWPAIPAAIALCFAFRVLSDTKAAAPDSALTRMLLQRPRTWTLMAAFGLVNAGYTSMVAWLPSYYQSHGWDRSESGNLLAVMAVCQAASALALPILAGRRIDRRPWLLPTLMLQAIGFFGLAIFPELSPGLWVGVCGAGLGGGFSLTIVAALDHLPRPEQAGALVGLMQGGGFLVAALGPFATALLHGLTGSFASGWVMHFGCVAMTLFLYLRFCPNRYRDVMECGPDRSQ